MKCAPHLITAPAVLAALPSQAEVLELKSEKTRRALIHFLL